MSKEKTTRRQFHKQVAALAVAPVLASAADARPGVATPGRAATAAEALAEVVRLRYGRHLSEEQLRHVRAAVAANVRMGERLGRVALDNGDEPAFAFSPDVP